MNHPYGIDNLFDKNCLSDFDKRFQDFALLKPIVTFMCYPFREDVEVDLLASNIAALFPLHTYVVEEEIWQYELILSLSLGLLDNFGDLLTKGKYPNMWRCATSLTFPAYRSK